MAREVHKLSEKQLARARKWLEDHWLFKVACPISGDNDWELGSFMIRSPVFQDDQVRYYPAYILFPVFCKTCGHALFFNAITMGLVTGQDNIGTVESEGV